LYEIILSYAVHFVFKHYMQISVIYLTNIVEDVTCITFMLFETCLISTSITTCYNITGSWEGNIF